jgi:hypothetical protein
MSLSALGSSSSQSILQLIHQRKDAMKSMISAVQSGDISSAQSSLSTLQQDSQGIGSVLGADPSSQSGASSQSKSKTDVAAIFSAVQAGDLSGAQSALQAAQLDRGAGSEGAGTTFTVSSSSAIPPAPSPTSTTSSPSAAAVSARTLLSDLNSVLSSILAGDGTNAQSAAGMLTNDVQTLTGPQTASSSPSSPTPGSGAGAFLSDLQSLASAAASNNSAGEQQAAQNLVNDIQNAGSGAGRIGGGHHRHGGHHHDSQGSGSSNTSGSQPSSSRIAVSAQSAYNEMVQLATQVTGPASTSLATNSTANAAAS